MIDDEAFVRAIVAAPGDDAPRLVYADWLDERGDPRGKYLRLLVECECRLADPGLKERTERQLRRAALLLNEVWVARVSPPPLGVCRNEVLFLDAGSPLNPSLIDRLEIRLNRRLPSEYRAFLLNHNGGSPDPRFGFTPHDRFEVHTLHTVGEWMTGPTGERYDNALECHVKDYWQRTGTFLLMPVGSYSREQWHSGASGETDEVLLGLQGEQKAKVYLGLDSLRLGHFGPTPVASSFAEFLSLLSDLPDDWVPDLD